jgi:tRNA C32,U32 (ribose-2'-O)-methylase TrmJ
LRDLVKKLKWPSSENWVDRETKQQIAKLRRDLKEAKTQLSYHLDHPYSKHVHDLQEAEQRLLLANSKVRVLKGYLDGQTLEANQQQYKCEGVRQRSNSF